MMCEQANPAVIFSNWDKLDQYTKTIIFYYARKKCYMLMAYTEVFVYLCLFDFIFSLLEISSVFYTYGCDYLIANVAVLDFSL